MADGDDRHVPRDDAGTDLQGDHAAGGRFRQRGDPEYRVPIDRGRLADLPDAEAARCRTSGCNL